MSSNRRGRPKRSDRDVTHVLQELLDVDPSAVAIAKENTAQPLGVAANKVEPSGLPAFRVSSALRKAVASDLITPECCRELSRVISDVAAVPAKGDDTSTANAVSELWNSATWGFTSKSARGDADNIPSGRTVDRIEHRVAASATLSERRKSEMLQARDF